MGFLVLILWRLPFVSELFCGCSFSFWSTRLYDSSTTLHPLMVPRPGSWTRNTFRFPHDVRYELIFSTSGCICQGTCFVFAWFRSDSFAILTYYEPRLTSDFEPRRTLACSRVRYSCMGGIMLPLAAKRGSPWRPWLLLCHFKMAKRLKNNNKNESFVRLRWRLPGPISLFQNDILFWIDTEVRWICEGWFVVVRLLTTGR